MFGAVPSILERVVPEESVYELMGYCLPPGTVVGTQAWSVHRDPRVFTDPYRFDPERWLETPHNSDHLNKMNQHFMPFGLGSRVCVAQRLAMIVMRVVIASIVRNFDIVAPPETTRQSMTPKDSYVWHLCIVLLLLLLIDVTSGNFSCIHGVQAAIHTSRLILRVSEAIFVFKLA